MKPTVCVDMDAVLASYTKWKGVDDIGNPLPGAVAFMRQLHRDGYEIVVHTTRLDTRVNPDRTAEQLRYLVKYWLDYWRIPFDRLEPKPLAVAYVDDRAVECRPMESDTAFEDALRKISRLVCRQTAAGDLPRTTEGETT